MNGSENTEAASETQDFDSTIPSETTVYSNVLPASGLYEGPVPPKPRVGNRLISDATGKAESKSATNRARDFHEEIRLDVDGHYPQMVVSGTIYVGRTKSLHWIANLSPSGLHRWTGTIWYRHGDTTLLPQTNVVISVRADALPNQPKATIKYTGAGVETQLITYDFTSPYFHPVEFEFDTVAGTCAVTQIETCAHPIRPAFLTCEALSIETVFKRAGFSVTTSPGGGSVLLSGAGTNTKWSNMEMHDAMQTYWSRNAGVAQWSMWVLFAALHERGPGLGGVMFDDIGPNHRQGTAIFNDSFIANHPPNDPVPAAFIARARFWTACHEIGHSFNMAHSWQKDLQQFGSSWKQLSNEPEVRSFMNYPRKVRGGETAFFSDFGFRFSDAELLFMRHAPARFVQMGNADWFDSHGFEQAAVSPEPKFKLRLRVNRAKQEFEFLEPVVLEIKLTNISSEPQLIDENVLSAEDAMTVILKKNGKAARQWTPFTQFCFKPKRIVLAPGQSMYESLYVATGRNGWDLAEPGRYAVQMSVTLENEDIISNLLSLRVAPPRGYDEEYIAQDFFSDAVGRILTFDGSNYLTTGNNTLREIVDRLSDRRVSVHARLALGNPMAHDCKLLSLGDSVQQMTSASANDGKFNICQANVDDARKELKKALMAEADVAAETLGHIGYKRYVDRFTDWLHERGDSITAVNGQDGLHRTLAARKVANWILTQATHRRDSYKSKSNG